MKDAHLADPELAFRELEALQDAVELALFCPDCNGTGKLGPRVGESCWCRRALCDVMQQQGALPAHPMDMAAAHRCPCGEGWVRQERWRELLDSGIYGSPDTVRVQRAAQKVGHAT